MIDYEIGYRFTNDEGYLDQHGGYKQAAQAAQQQQMGGGSPGLDPSMQQMQDPNQMQGQQQQDQSYLSAGANWVGNKAGQAQAATNNFFTQPEDAYGQQRQQRKLDQKGMVIQDWRKR